MFILPIKSRSRILKERKNPESAYKSKYIMLIVSPTPEKNIGPNAKYRATNFVCFLTVVSKRIHNRAVIRNKLRRRIKEAFKLVDVTLLKNKYDYQIIARHSIFKASVQSIKEDIEKCLRNEVEQINLEEDNIKNKKTHKRTKKNLTKTSEILKAKLE